MFEQIREVQQRVGAIRLEAKRPVVYPITRDDALWLCDRIGAVLNATQDARVTYGIIDPEEDTTSPMLTERDAIVRALYTGYHPFEIGGPSV